MGLAFATWGASLRMWSLALETVRSGEAELAGGGQGAAAGRGITLAAADLGPEVAGVALMARQQHGQ